MAEAFLISFEDLGIDAFLICLSIYTCGTDVCGNEPLAKVHFLNIGPETAGPAEPVPTSL